MYDLFEPCHMDSYQRSSRGRQGSDAGPRGTIFPSRMLTHILNMDCSETDFDVLKGSWRVDGEADQKDIGLRVGKRTQPVIILLSSSIEESQSIRLITYPVV